MTIYEIIKAAISVKQAAKHYGLNVNRNGMACCPFHNDRHPSLKLNEDYFFCFGCGDVLRGIMAPSECPLFRKVCTPENPVGPCMVSSEGSCAAYYRYY